MDPLGLWDERIHYGSKEYGGTKKWAREAGFSKEEAKMIAKANNNVDSIFGGKSFIPSDFLIALFAGNQSYHFDTYENDLLSGDIDSRIALSELHLTKATQLYNDGQGSEALKMLGEGLHALQDVYAHNSEFVNNDKILGSECKSHLAHPEADNPKYKPERYRQTKDATVDYLKRFKSSIKK